MNLKIIGLIHFRQIRWIIVSVMVSNLGISKYTMKGAIDTTIKPWFKNDIILYVDLNIITVYWEYWYSDISPNGK